MKLKNNLLSKKEDVTYSQSFSANIKNIGGYELIMKSPLYFQDQLRKFKNGEEVSLVIHNKKLKRTEQQNRYYWGVYLPLISQETRERDLNRLHELFKGKFLTEKIVEVLGEKVRLKKSTTKLSTLDFCEYILNIQDLTGVVPPSTESFGLESLKKESIDTFF